MPVFYDRAAFFMAVRGPLFVHLSEAQVDGCQALLAESEKRGLAVPALAYVLATAYWETARTMQPIREIGEGRGHAYGAVDRITGQAYYGRGFVQLTWKANYAKFSSLCSMDLVSDPDQALELGTATKILFEGMIKGLFTGKSLGHYITADRTDFVNARRIINGEDRAAEIAGFAQQFQAALKLASTQSAAKPTNLTTNTPSSLWNRVKSFARL